MWSRSKKGLAVIDPEKPRSKPENINAVASSTTEWHFCLTWLAAASTCLIAILYLVRKARTAGEDSWFPMSRALDFLHESSTGQVYQTLFFSQHVKFQYPPSGLLLLDFLRRLGVGTTTQLNAINVCLLIVTGFALAAFSVQLLGARTLFGQRVPIGPIAFFVAVSFYPNSLALQFGQIQILLGLLFLLSCLATLRGGHLVSGVLLAVAATVKPQFLFFGLLMIWQRDWRFVVGFAVVTGGALILSIELYGWQNHLDYLKVLTFLSQHGEYHHLNQSFNGILNRYLYDGPSVDHDADNPVPNSGFPPYIPVVYAFTTITSLLFAAIAFGLRRTGTDPIRKLAGLCAAAALFTMASPIAWVHHYNVLLPGYVVVLKLVLDRGRSESVWVQLSLLAISVALTGVPLMAPFGPTIPSLNLVQSHVFFGALLFIGVLLFELFSPPPHRVDGNGWKCRKCSS
jgi:hypothetical protein